MLRYVASIERHFELYLDNRHVMVRYISPLLSIYTILHRPSFEALLTTIAATPNNSECPSAFALDAKMTVTCMMKDKMRTI